jgi:hypothetical protein
MRLTGRQKGHVENNTGKVFQNRNHFPGEDDE